MGIVRVRYDREMCYYHLMNRPVGLRWLRSPMRKCDPLFPIGNRVGTTENGAASAYTANDLNQYTSRTVPGVAQVRGRAATGAVVGVTPPGGLPQPTDRQGETFHRNVPLDNTAGAVEADLTVTAVLPGQGQNGEDIVAEQIRAARVEGSPQAFTHDDDGNLLSDGRWTHSWNGENRLVATTSATAKLEFLYDHQGRRAEKRTYTGTPGNWTLAETRRFLYNGRNLIAEFTLSGTTLSLRRSHLWGLDLSESLQGAGGGVGGLLRTTLHDTTDTDYYPVYDGNGNIVRYLDANGADLAVLEYSPFGRPLQGTGTSVALLPFRFSIKFRDGETGLHYYGYRYYSPTLGRWLRRDPIGERGGRNLSGFVLNSATGSYDPLGLWRSGEKKGCGTDEIRDLMRAETEAKRRLGVWVEALKMVNTVDIIADMYRQNRLARDKHNEDVIKSFTWETISKLEIILDDGFNRNEYGVECE